MALVEKPLPNIFSMVDLRAIKSTIGYLLGH
jgi:hypothetical protein